MAKTTSRITPKQTASRRSPGESVGTMTSPMLKVMRAMEAAMNAATEASETPVGKLLLPSILSEHLWPAYRTVTSLRSVEHRYLLGEEAIAAKSR